VALFYPLPAVLELLHRCVLTGVVCKVGDERHAVVLHVDSVASCVQLTFNKDTLKAVRAFKENKFMQVFVSALHCLILDVTLHKIFKVAK